MIKLHNFTKTGTSTYTLNNTNKINFLQLLEEVNFVNVPKKSIVIQGEIIWGKF